MTRNDMLDLTGNTVLITGAGRGIGRGIAEVLAEAGADIALNALTDKHVTGTAEAISKSTGRRVIPFTGDVTSGAGANQLVQQVTDTFGKIDVLINNLGDALPGPLVKITETGPIPISDENLDRVMDLNLMGTLYCTRAVAPQMLERREGKIINISSYTAARSGGNVVLYTAAKSALTGYTRAQALEWATYGITVNAIAPGLFPEPNEMTEERAARSATWAEKHIPLKRTGELREVGYLARYLASSAANYMTGQTLYLDGGMSL